MHPADVRIACIYFVLHKDCCDSPVHGNFEVLPNVRAACHALPDGLTIHVPSQEDAALAHTAVTLHLLEKNTKHDCILEPLILVGLIELIRVHHTERARGRTGQGLPKAHLNPS
jgi:hypothetical protein